MIRVTVWNEFRHEKASKEVAAIYPNGLHATIAEFLGKNDDIECRLACLDDPEHGLTDDVLDNTDVLIWWGHMAHDQVSDAVVDKVQDHVLRGMGLIVLHSGHNSKIFKRLMGTSCSLKWRDGARERLWCANPGHPIAQGLPEHFELDVTFRRGLGNVFYFQPGHEANPTFHNENIQKVITNAVRWAAPTTKRPEIFCPCVEPLENV